MRRKVGRWLRLLAHRIDPPVQQNYWINGCSSTANPSGWGTFSVIATIRTPEST